MDIVYRTGPYGDWPCGSGLACAVPTWTSSRGGYYVSYFRIWLDNGFSWNYFGVRAGIAHELGHVYGLNEQYLDSQGGFACNNSVNSIMDTTFTTSACDGSYSPWQIDLDRAHENYVMGTAPFEPQNLASYKMTSDWMDVYWDDASPTESGYQMYAYYWQNNQWQGPYQNVFDTYQVAPGDPWAHGRLSRAFYRSWYQPVTWYIACMYLNNGVIGNRYWMCFPMQWLGSGPA